MRYNLMSVKAACECCYILEVNPVRVDDFLEMFCDKYKLQPERHSTRIRGMLLALQQRGIIRLEDDTIYLHNTLTTGLKMKIIG